MTSAPISSVHIAKHCARLGATSVVTFTVLVGLQWSSTWVPEEDVAAGLDDGSSRITNLDPRPGNRRTEQLAEHLQFMECEFAELSLGRVQRGFYPTRWQAAVFAPNRSNAPSETLLPTCKGSHASFLVVDHRGWEFIGPRIEVLRRTGRIVGEESPGPDPCELEPWGEPPPVARTNGGSLGSAPRNVRRRGRLPFAQSGCTPAAPSTSQLPRTPNRSNPGTGTARIHCIPSHCP